MKNGRYLDTEAMQCNAKSLPLCVCFLFAITDKVTVIHSICIQIFYKCTACSMSLSEINAQVYSKQGTSLCKLRKYYTKES